MAPPRKTILVARPPEGFRYKPQFLSQEEETALVAEIEKLPLKEYEFHGYLGKRRVLSFGLAYEMETASIVNKPDIPEYLMPLRERAAAFAGLMPDDIPHVLVTEYQAGTTIGWHRDRPVFRDVIGVSLLSRCIFRFRRRTPAGWERHSAILDPRSAYLLRGPVRELWEHSIPPVESLRYSITFRTFR
jgi:alkylated DNA repair dioxygenase AlkB